MTGPMSRRTSATGGRGNQVLYWIYAGRLTVALSIYGVALFLGQEPLLPEAIREIGARPLALGTLLVVVVFTAASYWWSHRKRVIASERFLYVQASLDVLLVSGIIFLTGGSESVFPPLLYIALVSGYALIMTVSAGVLIALLTGACYLAVVAFAYPEQFGLPVLLQTMIFTLVALVSGLIGGRLSQVGDRLSSLEGELHRLRFGTSDILRTIEAAVLTADEDGRAVYLNPAAAKLFDVDPDDWIGEPIAEALSLQAPGIVESLRETLATREPVRAREIEVESREEGAMPFSLSTALLEREGAPTLATVVLQDLRMARQLEELHLRATRLEVVAELSASLAHEIKNPLAAIRSATEQIADPDADREDRQTLSRLVIRETDRLSRLLGEFNDFARVNVEERKPIRLDEVIPEAVAIVAQSPEAQDRATFDVDIAAGLDDLWGDPDLIHRTLTNLLLNAVQVSDPNGTVTIRVIADALRSGYTPAGLGSGMPVRVRVIDDGPGIDPEDIARVFDPFYTRRQGGSGMGLAIAHRAVQAHGGALLVSSTPGHGATFAIILPRREPTARDTFSELAGDELSGHLDSSDTKHTTEQPAALDGFADRLG